MYEGAIKNSDHALVSGADVFRVREQPSPISSREINCLLRRRRERARHFPDGLFADPAWDILLHLYATELSGTRTTVLGVVEASQVPSTTGLRWLTVLIQNGLCEKTRDVVDGRRQFVSLTVAGSKALDDYFWNDREEGREDIRFAV